MPLHADYSEEGRQEGSCGPLMSVPEAVDQDYLVLFGRNGVWLFNPEDIKLLGKPVLSGFRDKRSRLFYFDFPSRLTKGTPVPAAGPLPPAPPSDPQVNLSQSPIPAATSHAASSVHL